MKTSKPKNRREWPTGCFRDLCVFEKADRCRQMGGEESLLGGGERRWLGNDGIEDPYLGF